MTPEAMVDAIMVRLRQHLDTATAVRPRLMTVEQTATYLGRTVNAVRCLEKRGTLPVVRADGRVMFDVHDLDRWIEQNKRGAE